MKSFTITLILVVTCIASCNNESVDKSEESANHLWQYIIDSTYIFSGLQEIEIKDSIMGFKYYNVSKEAFFDAFKRNICAIRLFDKKTNLNEYLKSELIFREGNTLRIRTKSGFKDFINVKEDSLNRQEEFFHSGVIGSYHLIKKIHFEDATTLIFNDNTETIDFYFPTLNVFALEDDGLLFVTESWNTDNVNLTSNYFIRIRNNRLDTVACCSTNWFTNFAFFDKSEKSLYYVYEFYDRNKINSCFAKMEIQEIIKDYE